MSQAEQTAQTADKWEFTRIDPAMIKIDAGSLWRETTDGNLEALKASILWRERRAKGSGLLVPLLVSKIEGVPFYQLEDGFRRFRAVQSLIAEGVTIESLPVRVLTTPLTLSERLMLMVQGYQPLGIMEEAKLIARLEKQGLSFENMHRLLDRPVESLKRRAILGKLTGPMAEALKNKKITLEEAEGFISADEEIDAAQKRLEKEFKNILETLPSAGSSIARPGFGKTKGKTKTPMPFEKLAAGLKLGESLGQKDAKIIPPDQKTKTAWMPKVLDPALHYLALEGLYEWMGGDNAVKHGYSKNAVGIVKLMMNYTGGKIGLQEIAERLKKF
jgi:hypothetical protein